MNVACPQLDHEEDQIAFQSLQREDLDREQIGRGQPVPMRLEERFPRCALASLWRRGHAAAEENPLHCVPANLVAQVGQRAPDAGVAPPGILDGHPHDQFANRLRRQRTTATATGAAVVFLRDESSIPAQDRVGGDDTSHSAQDPSPELLPADGKPTPLSVGQADRTAAQLFAKDSILLTEIVD